jgi:hypothetical protein
MLLAKQQKVTNPADSDRISFKLKIFPAKKEGMNKKRFFAQSFGRRSLI